jgi:serine/threonine-protein kinase
MPETGQRLGDYEILGPLGKGGMARVFKVRNVISNREEAMKILLPDLASDPDLAARFMAEIRTLAALEHPGIAQLRTAFQSQNQFVMVMELVEGTTLEQLAQSRIPPDQVLDYSSQILGALAYAHAHGVIHRDIKPANIMITAQGVVKLMDFGIAKSAEDVHLTRPGTTMGSASYMSPEQVRGDTVDGRTDLYSFGVMLYELLTGRKPFRADTAYSLLNAHLNEIPTAPMEVNPALSPELNDIVLRAMAKRPEDRFQTAEEFRLAIRRRRRRRPAPVPEPAQVPSPAPVRPSEGASPELVPTAPFEPSLDSPSKVRAAPRVLWISIGAAGAALVLAAVAMRWHGFFETHADQKSVTDTVITPASSPPPADTATPAPHSTDNTKTGVSPSAPRPPAHPVSRPSSQSSVSSGQGSAAATGPLAVAAVPSPAPTAPSREVREAQQRLVNLDARANSAASALQQARSRQQAQGKLLPVDILEDMNRARQFLAQAHAALASNELPAAIAYMNRTDVEITKVEKFLGR